MFRLTFVKVVHPIGIGFLPRKFISRPTLRSIQVGIKSRFNFRRRYRGAYCFIIFHLFFNRLDFFKINISKPHFLSHKFRLLYPVNLKTDMPRTSHPIKFKICDRNIIDKCLIAIIESPD